MELPGRKLLERARKFSNNLAAEPGGRYLLVLPARSVRLSRLCARLPASPSG